MDDTSGHSHPRFIDTLKGLSMKRLILVVVLVGFAGTPMTVTPSAQGAGAEQMLLQLERDWEQANSKNDQAALDRRTRGPCSRLA